MTKKVLSKKEYGLLKKNVKVAAYILISAGFVALGDWITAFDLESRGTLAVGLVAAVNLILLTTREIVKERQSRLVK